jgi:hypothetical protein
MGINEARDQYMAGTIDEHTRLVRFTRFIERQNCHNPVIGHRHRVVFKHRAGRFYRDAPTRCNQEIAMSHIALAGSVSGEAGR